MRIVSQRVVIDTNVYVSRFLRHTSLPGAAVARAWSQAKTLVSTETVMELRSVLSREKFARYVDRNALEPYLRMVWEIAEHITVTTPIQACRDPRDDKFLAVAYDGRADLLITGDADLLALHPFHGIDILTPADYLARP